MVNFKIGPEQRALIIRRLCLGGGVFLVFVALVAHVWLSWALAVVLDQSFMSVLFGVFPILASVVLAVALSVTLILSMAGQGTEAGLVLGSLWDKFGAYAASGASAVTGTSTKSIVDLLKSVDVAVFKRWFKFWAGITKAMTGGWLALTSLALFRNQLGESNPVVVVLLAAMFACLLFRRWFLAGAFCVGLGGYFLIADIDARAGGSDKPNPSTSAEATPTVPATPTPPVTPPVLPKEAVVEGGSATWTTVYENLPIANSFKVVHLPGAIRVAKEASAVVNHDGLLKENGAPFTLEEYEDYAGTPVDSWMLPASAAGPYCLVASITVGNESPSQGRIFPVKRTIVVEQGHSLHFWYNHIVDGEGRRWHESDTGAFRFKLIPTIAVLR